MTDRKEERERLRQERLAAHHAASSSEQRLQLVGYVVAGLIVAAIAIAVIVVVTNGGEEGAGVDAQGNAYPELAYIQDDIGSVPAGLEPDGREGATPPPVENGDLESAAKAAECELKLELPEEGNTHISDDEEEIDYKTSPPTSGDHYAGDESGSGALADGAYLNTPLFTRAVHALEHGRVEIQYSPDLSDAEQLEIKGVFEESPQGVILFPNGEMPYDVAITAWTRLAGCKTYDGAATLDVLRAFRDVHRFYGPEDVPPSISG